MKTRFAIGILALLAGAATHAATPVAHDNRSWMQPQAPFRIYGNTYYVGSRGLSAILITSPGGDILIDGTLPANAMMVEANIRALGFRLQDVKLILNSHAHFDHAGAIAALARDSGATVAASIPGARALMLGGDDPDDPQHGDAPLFPAVDNVRGVADGVTVRAGSLAVKAHYTPGHTPGSTTWTWTSCEAERCLAMVYADSLTLLATGNYRYTDRAHPERLAAYRRALETVSALPCDILLTPHPEAVDLLQRTGQAKAGGTREPLVDTNACKDYAARARVNLERLVAQKAGQPPAR
jgi:metallo-beta-lactamase class B